MREIYLNGLLLVCLIILLVGCGHFGKTRYVFEGPSMAPTIYDEDHITVDETYYDTHEVQRGEIILYETDASTLYVKRVLGLPGERIQMGNGHLLTDREPVSEDFIFQEITYDGLEMILEDDEYFVLGDAMDMSRDSRHIGPISERDIIGKVIKVKSK